MTTGGSREKNNYESRNYLSTFDLFHAWQVKMLKKAKRECNYLILGLQLDPLIDRLEKNGPTQSIIEHYIQPKGSKIDAKK